MGTRERDAKAAKAEGRGLRGGLGMQRDAEVMLLGQDAFGLFALGMRRRYGRECRSTSLAVVAGNRDGDLMV